MVFARARCRPGSRDAAHRPGGGRAVSRLPRQSPTLPAWPAAPGGAPCPRRRAGPGPGPAAPAVRPGGPASAGGRLRVAVLPCVVGVGRGRLGENLLDLRQRPVRLVRGVTSQLGAIQAECSQRHHALGGQQSQHLAEQPVQRLLMPGPEPDDGGMIRVQAPGDHPVADIAYAPLLHDSAGPLALAVHV